MQDKQGIRPSQHEFMKSRSCLTNLVSFCDKVTGLVDDGKTTDVFRLNLSKTSDTVSYNVLAKLVSHVLYGYTFHWEKKLLDGWA